MASTRYAAPPEQRPKKYSAFISHCKRVAGTEDRALWIQDTLNDSGISTFFDRTDLKLITMEQLKEDVLSSGCIVTVLDPSTFESEWVVFEHRTAVEAGIPIVPFYDADSYRWAELSHWVQKHPAFFTVPAVEYHRAYHAQSKALLCSKVRDEDLSLGVGQASAHGGASGAAAPPSSAPAGMSALATTTKAWRALLERVRELEGREMVARECSKLHRATGYVTDELGLVRPGGGDGALGGVLSELRAAAEQTRCV